MDFDFQNEHQTNQNQNEDGYYQEYCRLFLANIALTNQVKQLIEEKNHLRYRLGKYQDQECYSSFQRNQKAKRFRRNAHEIERFYKCTIKSCAKSYGSQGSLNQHYKLKHPQIYVTLPNVQPIQGSKYEEEASERNISQNEQNHNSTPTSNSKLNSILKELGDIKSFKSIKIEELRFQNDQNHKENYCGNIQNRFDHKLFQNSGQKPQFLNLMRKQESLITQDGNLKLKRSSRTIKKRDFNF